MAQARIASPFPTTRTLRLPSTIARQQKKGPALAPKNSTVSRIGSQVRSLRLAAGISSGALAAASVVSRSMMSRIERGLVSPSVETLDRIAKGLHVPVSRLFGDQALRNDFCHVSAGHGISVDRIGAVADYHYELLAHLLSGNQFIEPYLVTLLPNAKPYVTFQHPGRKFIYLLTGSINYRYGGKVISLLQGDTLMFDATALHGVEEVAEGPVSYLSIIFTLRD